MKKFTYAVPCYASLDLQAETKEEADEIAVAYLATADNAVDFSSNGINFQMDTDSGADIELLSEDEVE